MKGHQGNNHPSIHPSSQHYWEKLLLPPACKARARASHQNINNAWVLHLHKRREKIKKGQDRLEAENLIKFLITAAFCYHFITRRPWPWSSEQVHNHHIEIQECTVSEAEWNRIEYKHSFLNTYSEQRNVTAHTDLEAREIPPPKPDHVFFHLWTTYYAKMIWLYLSFTWSVCLCTWQLVCVFVC